MKAQCYAVIMAGGKGTRFWPLSRSRRPKHLLRLFDKKSLIRETAERILPLFGPEKTLVVTVEEHYGPIQKELRLLPKKNFLIEPQGRNTAPCIGLAAIEVACREPDAVMVVLPADHWIADARSLRKCLETATQFAEKSDSLITIGVRPGYPETGYGYILKGKKIIEHGNLSFHQVRGFKEKPGLKKAQALIRSGSLWNSGIFIWRASTILALLSRFAPSIHRGLERIREAAAARGLGSPAPKLRAAVAKEYRRMPDISIDYAVMEKAGSEGLVWTLRAGFGWSDVGSWAALRQILPPDRSGIAGVGRWLPFKSKDCLVYSPDRLVALLGIQDVVVVDTPDALLVSDIRRAQEVKELVEELARSGYRRYTIR